MVMLPQPSGCWCPGQGFSKRTKTESSPLVCRSCSLMRNSLCLMASLEPSSLFGLSRGLLKALLGQPQSRVGLPYATELPKGMPGLAHLACSSTNPSVQGPQGSQTSSSVQTSAGRTENCRSWLELEKKQGFGKE